MSNEVHDFLTETYGAGAHDKRFVCVNCDRNLSEDTARAAVDAPGEQFCRSCVVRCTKCLRFLHYTANIADFALKNSKLVGTCTECGSEPKPISVINLHM